MLRFMLDTDTCSYVMKRSPQAVLDRLQAVPVGEVCISVVTRAELLYGVEVSPKRVHDLAALEAFLPYVEVLDFASDAALHYAQIRADLKKRGALTLVTNNTADFGRVRGLALENWAEAPRRKR